MTGRYRYMRRLGSVWLPATLFLTCVPLPAQDAEPAPQPDDEGFIALFNGEDLDGWVGTGSAEWTVEDGVLIGKQGAGNSPGDLWTKQRFGDFELVCTFKVVWPANSGIWFRADPPDVVGYQVDILDKKEYGCTIGTIYCQGFLSQNLDESTVNLDDWNTVRLTVEGYHIKADLNGHVVADVEDEQKRFAEGVLGFQVHPGAQYGDMRIMVKECRIRPIEAK